MMTDKRIQCLLYLFLQSVLAFSVVDGELIYITPKENVSCSVLSSQKCITLSEYAQTVTNDISTGSTQQLVLMPGNHTLSTELLVTNVTRFSISANGSFDTDSIATTVTVICVQAARFLFQNIKSLHISGLHLLGCTENTLTMVDEFILNGGTIDGQGKNGTGLHMNSVKNAFITDCSFHLLKGSVVSFRNHSIAGGAILVNKTSLVLERSFFDHNSAYVGGALFAWNSNASFTSCTFTNNTASVDGGVMYIWSGRVTLNSSIATNNIAKRNGGVVYITRESLLTIEKSSFTFNEAKYGGCVRLYKGPVSVITDCNFSNNIVKGETADDPRHYGGALCVSYGRVSVFSTKFNNNNATYVGGALYSKHGELTLRSVELYRNYAQRGGALFVANSTPAIVQNTLFTNNKASYDGGAIWTQDCVLSIEDTQFSNNSAALASSIRSLSQITSNEIAITNTTFMYNYANFSTVYLAQNNVSLSGNTTFWRNKGSFFVYSCNMTVTGYANFSQNSYLFRNSSIVEGGALTTFQSSVIFNSHTSITENTADYGGALFITESELFNNGQLLIANNTALVTGGGIYAYQSGLNFKASSGVITMNIASSYGGGLYISSSIIRLFGGSLEIVRNAAERGGGASFSMNGKLYVIKDRPECFNKRFCNQNQQEWIRLDFIENTAQYGGAVYVADDSNSGTCASMPFRVRSTAGEECFFQGIALYSFYDRSSMNYRNTEFVDNVAAIAGDTIYGGLLDRCSVSPYAEVFEKYYAIEQYTANSLEYLQNVTNIKNGSVYDEISSDPVRVCFCYSGRPNCSYELPTVFVKKGHTFNVPAVAVNQINSTVEGVIRSILLSGDGAVSDGEYSQQAHNVCINLNYTLSSPNPTEELVLFAEGPCKDIGISRKFVSVSFLPCDFCPIGFKVPRSSCVCECHPKLYPDYVTSCSFASQTVRRKDNVWISYVNETDMEGFITYPYCPYDYCHPVSSEVNIDLNVKDGSDAQCDYNRSNLLCGACKDGLSLTLGSSRCRPCSNNWLLLLVLFAFAGIALVILLLVCNLTVAVGTINGLIFYANIIAGNRAALVPLQKPTSRILAIFIAWLNLDFGIETCLYNGLNGYVKTWLQLTFPAYVVFLVILVIILCESSRKISNFLHGRDPVATLATLLLLSYSKILRVIIDVFAFATIDYPDGSSDTVWLFDANVHYLEFKHTLLFVTALIILVIGLVYTIFLFSWQWLQLCSERKGCKWISNSKLFCSINPHFAPYSPKHHYWTGLLLLARLLLYIISAVNVFGDPSVNLLSILVLAIFLLFLKERYAAKVYRQWLINSLESSYIFNLILFSGASLYVRATYGGKQEVVAAVSLSIAFLTFIVILCYHTYEYVLTKYQDKLLKPFMWFVNRKTKNAKSERAVTLLGGNNLTDYYNFSDDDSTSVSGGEIVITPSDNSLTSSRVRKISTVE